MLIENSFSEQKKEYRVVLFGSYEQMNRIKKLKNKLRLEGYSKTDYVEALPNPPGLDDEGSTSKFASKKSKFYQGWSDVNIFVLFKEANQGSVAIEIEHLFNKMPDRKACASFLFEKGIKLATMIKGTIEENECFIEAFFDDDDELFETVQSNCWIHLTEDNCEKTRRFEDNE